MCSIHISRTMKENIEHRDGKVIRTREYEDGRRDVAIGIETLDVDRDDPDTKEAAEIIERDVLPEVMPQAIQELADEKVHVLVIHTPTSQFSQLIVKRKEVLSFVTKTLQKFRESNKGELNVDQFTVVVLTKPQEGQQVQVESARKI
jgi:hypothetical protein